MLKFTNDSGKGLRLPLRLWPALQIPNFHRYFNVLTDTVSLIYPLQDVCVRVQDKIMIISGNINT